MAVFVGAVLLLNGRPLSASPDPTEDQLWNWMCALHGWPPDHTLQDASLEIRTTGLNDPSFILWNYSWHGFRAILPIRLDMKEMPAAFKGFADFQNRPFAVQKVTRGHDRGNWLVGCPVLPFSYQVIQPTSRAWGPSENRVQSSPDSWTSPEWSVRWESLTGGIRGLELQGVPILQHPEGIALVPHLSEQLENRRPGLPVKTLDWVEDGPIRWACEMDLGEPLECQARLEYCVDPMMVRFTLWGRNLPGDVWRIPMPQAADGIEPILFERGPSGPEWFFAWSNEPGSRVVSLHMTAAGKLDADAGENVGDGEEWFPETMRWEHPPSEEGGRESFFFQWTLRGVSIQPEYGVKVALDGLLQEQGHWLKLAPVPSEQAGKRVAAASGIMLRGPALIGGEPRKGEEFGEWFLPVLPRYEAVETEQPWSFVLWLEESPRDVAYSIGWPGEASGDPGWIPVGPARNSFPVQLPRAPGEPIWLRIRWP